MRHYEWPQPSDEVLHSPQEFSVFQVIEIDNGGKQSFSDDFGWTELPPLFEGTGVQEVQWPSREATGQPYYKYDPLSSLWWVMS